MRSRSSATPALSRRVYAPASRFSSIVICGKTRRASGTEAIPPVTRDLVEECVMSLPRNRIAPCFTLTRPRIVFIVVDFPEALPPSSDTISPSPTVSVLPRSAWNGP